jgi:transposase
LFAALETATGRVYGGHYRRKRRDEFLDFLDQLIEAHPGKELHLVLDNLSTHKLPSEHPWHRRHPEVHFHFTPTHASWLNQIEIWFSILSDQALRGASFRSVTELTRAIDAFIAAYNQTATPFAWTKVNVTAKSMSGKYANLKN